MDAQAVPIATGEIATGEFETRFETDIYQFEGVAGDRFFIDYISGGTYRDASYRRSETGTNFRLIDPDGNQILEEYFKSDKKDLVLSQTGIYTILLEDDFSNSTTGEYIFNILSQATSPSNLTLNEVVNSTLEQDSYSFTLDRDSLLYFDSLTYSFNFNWSLTKVDRESESIVEGRRFDQSDSKDIEPIWYLYKKGYRMK